MRKFFSGGRGMVLAFVLGLLLAGTGTATAAKLITGKDIKNGSIAEKDLSKKVQKKLKKVGQQGPAGPQGTQGLQGTQGPQGDRGPAGPSYATAGTVTAGSTPDLTGYTPSGWKQEFTTPDAGPVQVASTVSLFLNCSGTGGPGYSCGVNYALAVDGKPVKGSLFGFNTFSPTFSSRDLTLFGVLDDLPAGKHELRVYTKPVEFGGADASPGSSPWSFSVQRVGSVG